MNSRYLSNIALTIAGAFLVVVSQVWAAPTFMWLMFGIGIVALVLAGAGAIPGRGIVQRTLDGAIGILAAWTIVASLVFSGSTVIWLGFASAVAFVGLAVIGLTLHEFYTERVVHSLEVRGTNRTTNSSVDRELAGIH